MVSSSLDKHTIKTKNFEGPFAVLLELIESEKLNITEISLAHVAEQFLDYIASHEQLPAQELADFLLVASKLLYIKSKAVLPKTITIEEDEGPSLESQLKMYKLYKDATGNIEQRVTNTKTALFGKIQGPQLAAGFYPAESLNMEDMAKAMYAVLEKLKPLISLPHVQVERVVSISERIEQIKQKLLSQAKTSFKDIMEEGTRQEIIVSFLAILELVKHRAINVQQQQAYEDIIIKRV